MMRHWLLDKKTRIAAYLAEDKLFATLFLMLLVGYAAPIIIVKYLPMQDFVAHLRIVELWRQAGDQSTLIGREHEALSWIHPYTGYHILLRGLGVLMSLHAAQKLLLLCYAVGLPLSFLSLLGAMGRDRRYALLCFPFIYNAPFIFGLLPQAVSLPLILYGTALLKRQLDEPSIGREIGLSLMTLAIFFCHFSAYFAFGMIVFVLLVSHLTLPAGHSGGLAKRTLRTTGSFIAQLFRRGLFTIPSLAVAIYWVAQTIDQQGLVPVYAPISVNLVNLYRGVTDIRIHWIDELVLVVTLFAAAAPLLLRPKSSANRRDKTEGNSTDEQPPRRSFAIPLAGLVLFLLIFVLPASAKKPAEIWAPNLRMALPAILLLMTLPRPRLRGCRLLLILPGILIALFWGIEISRGFIIFDKEAQQIDPVIDAMKREKKMLPVYYHGGDGMHHGGPFMHLPHLYQLRKGGYLPYGLVGGPAVPVRLKNHYPAPPWPMPLAFRYHKHAKPYDYFLVLWPKGPQGIRTFVGAGNNVRLIKYRGRFHLYQNVGPLRPR